MKKSTFKVLFLIRRNQVNKDGKCAIIIKITVDGEYERLNSTLSIEPDLWDAAAYKAIGRSSKIAEFNKRIEDMRHVLKEHYYDLLNRHGYVTAEMVKNAFTGVTAKEESLVTLYLQHLEDTKKLIAIRYFQYDGEGTLKLVDGPVLVNNDRVLLESKTFRVNYTAQSSEAVKFGIWIEDNFGSTPRQQTFEFNSKDSDDDGGKTPGIISPVNPGTITPIGL